MASGEIIKSFLVGLGFDVDESSLAVFNKNIATAAIRITALYTTINAFAGSMVFAFSKISEGFEQMGYEYHLIAPAVSKAILLRNELLKAYSAAGINIRKTIAESLKLNFSFEKTKFALEAIYKSVGSKFFGLLTKQSDAFRKKLYQNMPYIINALEHLVKFTFKALESVTQLGLRLWSIFTRVYDFFIELDKATNGWSTIVLGLVAAWKLLNLSFIATPLGALLTGFLAILALYDDFKTFKEGGKSFFNWAPLIPVLDQVAVILTSIRDLAIQIGRAFSDIFKGNCGGLISDLGKIADAFLRIDAAIDSIARKLGGKIFNDILNFRDKVDKWFFDLFKGGDNGASNSGFNLNNQLNALNSPLSNPLGSGGGNTSNINANMQTSINISGTPDSAGTARASAYEQQGVNRDFVRNLKGAIA
jgi:hypothetical protein